MIGVIDVRGDRAAIRRAYDLFSYIWGVAAAILERNGLKRGLARAKMQPGECVLEVAVGTGVAFARLQEQVGKKGLAVGLDIAPRMLAMTRRRVPDAYLVQADARELPFPDACFDLLWSSYFLDLVPAGELTALLVEFRRVLRPAGRLLLVNFSKEGDRLTWWEGAYSRTPAWLVPYVFGGCRPIQSVPFLREAGFTDIEREFVSGSLYSEIVMARCPRSLPQ